MTTYAEAKAAIEAALVDNRTTYVKPSEVKALVVALTDAIEALLDAKAPLSSPGLTGVPEAPTAAPGTNTTQISTTAFVKAAIDAAVASLLNSAPGALDTLDELAAALGDDANFATTITNALALRAPLASPALTGTPTAPTVAGTSDNSTKIATTAFVQAVLASIGAFVVASKAEAEAGTDNTNGMTPLRTTQAAIARGAGLRNIVGRNGGLEVWQRGTSISVAASTTAYTADGWYLATGANQASTVSRQSGLNNGSVFAARIARNSGQTGTGVLRFAFPLDTNELARLRNQAAVLSFQVRAGANWSPSSGTLSYALHCGTGSVAKRNASAYTGETSPITGTINLTAGGSAQQVVSSISNAISTDITCAELQFSWTPTGAAGANDWIEIDDIQLEIVPAGISGVTPRFERVPFSSELIQCLRHYAKTFQYDTTPAQNAGSTGSLYCIASGPIVWANWGLPVTMRATPTVVTYNTIASNSNWSANPSSPTASATAGVNIVRITGSGATDQNGFEIHATADASI